MLGAVAALPLAAVAREAATLASAARDSGLVFGVAVRLDQLRADKAFRDAVVRECALVTPEVELKWAWIESEQGSLNFAPIDEIAAFAAAYRKRMHGHALLWHGSIPQWAEAALAARPDWDIVRRFLSSVIPRYGAAVDTWDVVNEPIETGYRMDGLRPSPFLEAFGPDYIRRALEDARTFAPRASLLINEYGLDYDLPVERDRRYLFLRLVEGLKKAGAPLDGVGIQAHLDLDHQAAFREEVLAAFLAELAGFGLEIRITELDVKEAEYAVPVRERDRRVAEAVRRYLDVAIDSPALRGITCWGLSDRYSWLRVTDKDLAREKGRWQAGEHPGLNRGLPLDGDLRPKLLHATLSDAFVTRGRRQDKTS